MSRLSEVVAPLVSLMRHVQAPTGLMAVGFSILLVAWLVAAEELDLRRSRRAVD